MKSPLLRSTDEYFVADGKRIRRDDLDEFDLRSDPRFDAMEVDSECRSLIVVPGAKDGPAVFFHHSVGFEGFTKPCLLGNGVTLRLADARRISSALNTMSEADDLWIHEGHADPLVRLVQFVRNHGEPKTQARRGSADRREASLAVIAERDGTVRYAFVRSGKARWLEGFPLGVGPQMSIEVACRLAKALAQIESELPPPAPGFAEMESFLTVVPALIHEILGLPSVPVRQVLRLD
ncbi:hypothetical protein GC173_14790 [bacterium]|nr:hypothetical protein [bacterium]